VIDRQLAPRVRTDLVVECSLLVMGLRFSAWMPMRCIVRRSASEAVRAKQHTLPRLMPTNSVCRMIGSARSRSIQSLYAQRADLAERAGQKNHSPRPTGRSSCATPSGQSPARPPTRHRTRWPLGPAAGSSNPASQNSSATSVFSADSRTVRGSVAGQLSARFGQRSRKAANTAKLHGFSRGFADAGFQ
jgi:hypothetical protein